MNTMGSREPSHMTGGFKSNVCAVSNHSMPRISTNGLFPPPPSQYMVDVFLMCVFLDYFADKMVNTRSQNIVL